MKLKDNGKKVIVSGNTSGTIREFRISNNKTVFKLLRNTLYTNKVGAICREVASNSRDANRESGKPDVPVEITIAVPDNILAQGDMYISFKDVGPGITPKRMFDVFMQYGESTKRGTNTQIGGFGLGAKTPFAYSDTFTIVTICDVKGKRMKYAYAATLNASESGQMIPISEEEVGKKVETGTEIIVPIKREDKHRFVAEVYKNTQFWDVRPNYTGFTGGYGEEVTPDDIEILADEPKFQVLKHTGKHIGESTAYIAMIDDIPYVLDVDEMGWRGVAGYGLGRGKTIVFRFGNGELEIAASRESIQYDAGDNKELITDKYNAFREWIVEQVAEYISDSNTWLEACYRRNELLNSDFTGTIASAGVKLVPATMLDEIEFKGVKLQKSKTFKFHKFEYLKESVQAHLSGYKANHGPDLSASFTKAWEAPFFYMDATKKSTGKHKTLYDNHNGHFVLVSATPLAKPTKELVKDISDKKLKREKMKAYADKYKADLEKIEEEKEFITDQLGKTIKSYAATAATKGASAGGTYYKKTNDLKIKVRQAGYSFNYPSDWQGGVVTHFRKEKAMDKNYVYLTTDRLTSVRYDEFGQYGYHVQAYLVFENPESFVDVTKTTTEAVIVGKNKVQYFEAANQMAVENVEKYVKKKYGKVMNQIVTADAVESFDIPEFYKALKLGKEIDAAVKFLEKPVYPKKYEDPKIKGQFYISLYEIWGAKVSPAYVKHVATLAAIEEKYPLLRHLKCSSDVDPAQVNEYIKLIDGKSSKKKS